MGIIEDIERRRRLEAEQVSAAEDTRRKRHQAENERLAPIQAEEKRIRELRHYAINSSLIPEMMEALAIEVGSPVLYDGGARTTSYTSGALRIGWQTSETFSDSQGLLATLRRQIPDRYHIYTERRITFEGFEDGSVRVGRDILAPEFARDRQAVDGAITKAYYSPEVIRERLKSDSSYSPVEKCGQ